MKRPKRRPSTEPLLKSRSEARAREEPRGRQRTPPGDDLGAAELAERLAGRLRELRRSRHWSLDDLSRASGVSRAALWQIESQRSNPSIGVLWKIASGLGLAFAELFGATAEQVMVQRRAESPAVRSGDGKMESRLVSPPGGAVGIEIYEMRLAARSSHQAEGHRAGTREVITVLSGALRLRVGSETYDAGSGDSVAFPADKPHAYENPGQSEARYHDLIVYGR